ncbi:transposase family protein [Aureimonas phyllosphaerae]|uniref:transposase family protein n=1 Tax=Aureimonas phyllosphaerae TaxID=1166078 RepID=UPI003A5C7260
MHSRYHRRVADLPLGGRAVQLQLVARRFRCDGLDCRQRIFAERFGASVPDPRKDKGLPLRLGWQTMRDRACLPVHRTPFPPVVPRSRGRYAR